MSFVVLDVAEFLCWGHAQHRMVFHKIVIILISLKMLNCFVDSFESSSWSGKASNDALYCFDKVVEIFGFVDCDYVFDFVSVNFTDWLDV